MKSSGPTELPTSHMLPWLIAWNSLILWPGCVSPVALHRAVLAYDEQVARVTREQLLLNIVRASDSHPIHFTLVPSVAATFHFQASAGITPPEGDARGLVAPLINATVAENPTITIIPIEGEEFTQRLLTPIEESRLLSLVSMGTDLNMLLRLTAASVRLFERGDERRVSNDPARLAEYQEFRRLVGHLAALNRKEHVHIQRIMAQTVWEGPMRGALEPQDILAGIEKDYKWQSLPQSGAYRLTRSRLLVSSYPAGALDPAQLDRLGARAKEWPPNEILVDIRPGFPGGEYPIQGTIQLRSFDSILRFLGLGIPNTGQDPSQADEGGTNPSTLLTIQKVVSPPNGAVTARYQGQLYAVAKKTWDLEVFRLLYQLFQMTVKPIQAPVPGITIAK
jgi:hypothetical protein